MDLIYNSDHFLLVEVLELLVIFLEFVEICLRQDCFRQVLRRTLGVKEPSVNLTANSLWINFERWIHCTVEHVLYVQTCEEWVCKDFINISITTESARLFLVEKFKHKINKLI